MKWTLLLIAAFLLFTVGSFVWFVATWSDPDAVTDARNPVLSAEAVGT